MKMACEGVRKHIPEEAFQECFNSWNARMEKYVGSSTETVAFQVYEILKIDHEFLQFF